MGRRALPAVAGLVLLASLLPACSRPQPEIATGTMLPEAWFPPSGPGEQIGTPGVMWVFRTADCLSCEELDFALRRLKATLPDVEIRALHVGTSQERRLVERFLTGRRVGVQSTVTVSPREFQRAYGATALPAILIHSGGEVVWVSTRAGVPMQPATLDSLIRRIVGGKPLPADPAATE
jgi:hypothetical protein